MNFTQFSAYLPVIAFGLLCLLLLFLSYISSKSWWSTRLCLSPPLSARASQEFCSCQGSVCHADPSFQAKLPSYSPPRLRLHKANCLLNIFTGMPYSSNLTCPSLFLPKLFLQMPLPQQMAQPSTCHSIKILRLIRKLLLSLCSLAINTKACQIRSEMFKLLVSIPAPFPSP